MNNDTEGKRGVGFENSNAESTEYMNGKNSKPGKTKIIAIGINQYQHREHWPDLKYPVNDCHKLLDVLRQKYNPGNFLVRELYNDDASALSVYSELRILTEKRENETIEENDDIIIIYTGHGFHSKLGFGCWVGWDAGDPKADSTLKYNMITLDEIVQFLQNIRAKNILLIVDACHGEKFADRTISLPAIHIPKSGKLDVNATRYILTSGRKGAVPDESLFMKYLVELLQNNTKTELSVGALEIAISEKIGRGKTYLPFSKNLVPNEHDGGKFYFRISDKYFFKTEETTVLTTLERILVQLRSGSQKYRELLYSGRFRYVRIEDVLLPITDYLPVTELSLEINKETKSVQETLEYLWKESDSHALILGDGGMGKTMSVLRLWEILLDRIDNPVPIYVALNEYNLAKPEERTDFVARYIAKHYLGLSLVSQEQTDKIWEFFKTEKTKDKKRIPSVVILLDGLNEVTADRTSLNSELFRVSTEATSVQFVVTSRSGAVENFAWAQGFHQTKLLPLEKEVIIRHLLKNNREIPKEKEVYQLLGNPMMLTIYSHTEQQSEAFRTDSRFNFKFPVNKEAELMWNFREAQLVKLLESLGNQPTSKSQEEKDFQAFLLKYVVPYFAWRMEKAGQYFITDRITVNNEFNFDLLISDALQYLNKNTITQEAEAFWRYLKSVAPTNSVSDSIRRTRKIRDFLVEHLYILIPESDELRFLHQNFRDFYSACHLLNCIAFSLSQKERPIEWKERTFPIYLRKMIGEIEGEYLFDPFKILEAKSEYLSKQIWRNYLSELAIQCRDIDMISDYTVWNLITILHETRGTLSGANLKRLDLRLIVLNGVILFAHHGSRYLCPNIEGAKINGKQFIFNGHIGHITNIDLSKDGKKILSSSRDSTIREWSIETGQCLNMYRDHSEGVIAAYYLSEGKISISSDRTIRKWNENGECTFELKLNNIKKTVFKFASLCPKGKHMTFLQEESLYLLSINDMKLTELNNYNGSINCGIFDQSGKLIILGLNDGSIKILSIESKKSIMDLFIEKSKTRSSLLFSNESDNKIIDLSCSLDGKRLVACTINTIQEWSIESGERLRLIKSDYKEYYKKVRYNSDSTRLLIINDSKAYERSLNSAGINQNYSKPGVFGHTTTGLYNFFATSIFLGYSDGSIREFRTIDGTYKLEISGFNNSVTSAIYSVDEKKIIASSDDKTIKEWLISQKKCIQTIKCDEFRIETGLRNNTVNKIITTSSNNIYEWNMFSGKLKRMLVGHSKKVNSAIVGENNTIVSASDDGYIFNWSEEKNGKRNGYIEYLISLNEEIISVSYYATCNTIYFFTCEGGIGQITSNSYKIIYIDKILQKKMHSAVFSSDHSRVLVNSFSRLGSDEIIREFNVESGKLINHFYGVGSPLSMSYSPNLSSIISSSIDGYIKEHSLETRELHNSIFAHEDAINSVNYSLDGSKILSGSTDGKIKEWDSKSNLLIETYYNDPGFFIHALDFRNLHPDSIFTDEEKERMRRYGAIFNDQDKADWEAAVNDAYGDMEE